MLNIKNLKVGLAEEDKQILKGVDLNIGEGEIHAIMGPNGSGKSTTLAAIVNEINKTKTHNIITVEDPVEFIHKDNKIKRQHIYIPTEKWIMQLGKRLEFNC